MKDLKVGDFLYQTDQELFLVVIDETEDAYQFAVHGWRTIDKERVEEYVDNEKPMIHTESEVREVIGEHGSEQTRQKFEQLRKLFKTYVEVDTGKGPQKDFALDDTE